MNNYIAIQDLDLSNATVIGFNNCAVEVQGCDLVCLNHFGNTEAKFPIELNSRHRITRGLPDDVGIDEEGNLEVLDVDYDDEDYHCEDEQPVEILEGYSYISGMNFTIVIKNNI